MTTLSFTTEPEWVIFGVPLGTPGNSAGVSIYASRTLDRAQLARVAGQVGFAFSADDYVIVEGRTYAEALQRLMERWAPDGTEQRALGRGG